MPSGSDYDYVNDSGGGSSSNSGGGFGMFSTDFGLGTLISNMSEVYGSGQRRHKEDIRRRNEQADFDRSRMAPDMMAKVEAAKAAGIHPSMVFGGGSVAQGSPILSATPPPPPGELPTR